MSAGASPRTPYGSREEERGGFTATTQARLLEMQPLLKWISLIGDATNYLVTMIPINTVFGEHTLDLWSTLTWTGGSSIK